MSVAPIIALHVRTCSRFSTVTALMGFVVISHMLSHRRGVDCQEYGTLGSLFVVYVTPSIVHPGGSRVWWGLFCSDWLFASRVAPVSGGDSVVVLQVVPLLRLDLGVVTYRNGFVSMNVTQ